MKSLLEWFGLAVLALIMLAGGSLYFFGDEMMSAEFWENEIEAFEAADAEHAPHKGARRQ